MKDNNNFYRISYALINKDFFLVFAGLPIGLSVNLFWSDLNIYYDYFIPAIVVTAVCIVLLVLLKDKLTNTYNEQKLMDEEMYRGDNNRPPATKRFLFDNTLKAIAKNKLVKAALIILPILFFLLIIGDGWLLEKAHGFGADNNIKTIQDADNNKIAVKEREINVLVADTAHLEDKVRGLNQEIVNLQKKHK